MMFKRLLALLLFLLLFLSAAAAEGTIAAYYMPEGAEMCYLTEADSFSVPKGLEPMYELMQYAQLNGDVYLLRMKNGRALASVSCTPVRTPRTARQLQELWPQIARDIAAQANSVNDDASCATVETLYGYELLHIQTEIAAGTSTVVPLSAEGFAFCRGNEMLEIWAVHPTEAVYLFDETAAAELESDCRDLKDFLSSLDFSAETSQITSGMPYADSKGRFSLMLPPMATVITAESPEEAVAKAREAYEAANAPGAGHVFDEYMKDVREQDVTLILTEDMRGAVQIYCQKQPSFRGVTTEMLCGAAPKIRDAAAERFGTALLLAVEDGGSRLSGHSQSALSFWLRSEECNLQLDVLSCVLAEDWLCEVDVYTSDGDQTLRKQLHLLLTQTLSYTVE